MSFKALSFDIETVPLLSSMAAEYPEGERSPPSNYKNEEAIARWHENDKAQWELGRVKEYSLNPRLGRVVCIGYYDGSESMGDLAKTEADEAGLLKRFWGAVEQHGQICGWNTFGFDLPFIITRSIILGVDPGKVNIPTYLKRYTNPYHFDARYALNNWDVRAPGKLAEWLVALGMDPKSDDPANVWPMVKAGEWDRLMSYANQDAKQAHEVCARVARFYL